MDVCTTNLHVFCGLGKGIGPCPMVCLVEGTSTWGTSLYAFSHKVKREFDSHSWQ